MAFPQQRFYRAKLVPRTGWRRQLRRWHGVQRLLHPATHISPSGTNVILNWPTNVAGFDYTGHTLQSTANLVSPVVWDTNSPAPVVLNGQNMVTSRITGTRKFYGLLSSF